MGEEVNDLLRQYSEESDPFKKSSILTTLRFTYNVPLITISKTVGSKPALLSHFLRLRKLPETVIDGYRSELITLSHLFIIARLSTPQEMVQAYESVLARSLSTTQTDDLIRKMLHNVETVGHTVSNEEMQKLTDQMKENGIDTKLTQTRIRSTLSFTTSGSLEETTKKLSSVIQKLVDPPKDSTEDRS